MKFYLLLSFILASIVLALPTEAKEKKKKPKPYRLKGIYKRGAKIQWGSSCQNPKGQGLLFGGSTNNQDGRPHTSIFKDGQWVSIIDRLRKNNSLQKDYDTIWQVRNETKDFLAILRKLYFKGLEANEEKKQIEALLTVRQKKLKETLSNSKKSLNNKSSATLHEKEIIAFALKQLALTDKVINNDIKIISPTSIKAWYQAQINLENTAVVLDAEPPARTLSPIAYDSKTDSYIIFGGDHFDHLTSDTWVFDNKQKKWLVRFPQKSPSPRARHTITATDGKISITGGYRYYSNMDYCGGQYVNIDDNGWIYDIEKNSWSGGKLSVSLSTREYRSKQFHPDYYLQGDKPNAKSWEEKLKNLPANEWVSTKPPYRPRLNRDWGFAVMDPNEDVILRWSGGHSAHGGTDVPHYHLSTNRWELTNPVEFPLDCLYSNTTYPDGFNFNQRPWITGHTYQNYNYDLVNKKMVFTPRNKLYFYDTIKGDWLKKSTNKPKSMFYNGSFYTLTAITTPSKLFCWTGQGKMLEMENLTFKNIKTNGEKLNAVKVDRTTFCYDTKRSRILMMIGHKNFSGKLQSMDIKSKTIVNIQPKNSEAAKGIGQFDRACYDEKNDLFFIASTLSNYGKHTPTPVYDCKNNRWAMIDIKYKTSKHWSGRTSRHFPHGHSAGIMYDKKRQLYWGTDTNSNVYVLKLDLSILPLKDLALGTISPKQKKK